jgi:hypothetical protein
MNSGGRIRRWWNPPESPQEIAAEKRLDEVAREHAGEALHNPLGIAHSHPEAWENRGLHEALREDEEKSEGDEKS